MLSRNILVGDSGDDDRSEQLRLSARPNEPVQEEVDYGRVPVNNF